MVQIPNVILQLPLVVLTENFDKTICKVNISKEIYKESKGRKVCWSKQIDFGFTSDILKQNPVPEQVLVTT